jgi:hypothetical protein
MTSSHPTPALCQWFSWLAAALDRRSAPRLAPLFLGAVLARGRRTGASWIRAARLSDRFQSCYIAVAAAGKRSDRINRRLLTGGSRATGRGDRTADPRPGRHPDAALRAARPGGRHSPQPDARPGRLALPLRPRLRRPRAPRTRPGVGRDRLAAAAPGLISDLDDRIPASGLFLRRRGVAFDDSLSTGFAVSNEE